MTSLLLRSTAVAAALFLVSGCGGGSGTVPVRGTVTFKGKPVPSGTVTFIPDSGPHATGELGPDGSYTVATYRSGDGAVPGSYKVVVVAVQDTSDRLPEVPPAPSGKACRMADKRLWRMPPTLPNETRHNNGHSY
jgi:hypothetical protein